MSYKLPPKPSKPHPSLIPPKTQAVLEAESAAKAASAARLGESARKGYFGVRAVGVAFVVGLGAILGAQLKERRDLSARAKLQESAGNGTSLAIGDEDVVQTNTVEAPITNQESSNAVQQDTNLTLAGVVDRGASYNERQIALLQERRGILTRQKLELEQKIVNVREKQKRIEEIEGRRTAGAEVER